MYDKKLILRENTATNKTKANTFKIQSHFTYQ